MILPIGRLSFTLLVISILPNTVSTDDAVATVIKEEEAIVVDISSQSPSEIPTTFPTTEIPSGLPSASPSVESSRVPSQSPSLYPSEIPTPSPTTTQSPSEEPSQIPSFFPTSSVLPSSLPSQLPSQIPSQFPSQLPSDKPSQFPSMFPSTTVPSNMPSDYPTFLPTANDKPSRSYSYNPHHRHGPKNWNMVYARDNEYQEWGGLDVSSNECRGEEQSPIELWRNSKCKEWHQVRTRRGDFDFRKIDFEIHPNALRAEMPREYTKKWTETKKKKKGNETIYYEVEYEKTYYPPMADFPYDWPIQNAKHFEIKIPSEHMLYRKQYPGELTIAHVRSSGSIIILSVMLDDSNDIKNRPLQAFLDEWEEEWEDMHDDCNRRRRLREKYNVTDTYYTNSTKIKSRRRLRPHKTSEELMEIFGLNSEDEIKRPSGMSSTTQYTNIFKNNHTIQTKQQNLFRLDKNNPKQMMMMDKIGDSADWALYKMLPTVWFFGYEGSLTVPPCSEIVHWRVLEKPMDISHDQLKLIQKMLLNQYDEDCEPIHISNYGRLNRPIQRIKGKRKVWHCTETDFEPDDWDKWEDLEPQFFYEREVLDY